MADSTEAPGRDRRLTAEQLAVLIGDTEARIEQLTERGIIAADRDGRYAPADVHRVRIVDGFEAAGVPLDVLIQAQNAGLISAEYYGELHPAPGPASGRTYDAFKKVLGGSGEPLPSLFAAFGLAEPEASAHLSVEDEAFLEELVGLVGQTRHVDLLLRIIRQFGESTRRASVAALETYAQVIERLGPEAFGVPTAEFFDRDFRPWARIALALPAVAEWLATKHMSREIDEYSIASTERLLAQSGFMPARSGRDPAVAFIDLAGFTALAHERGDAAAADVALRLGDVASRTAIAHDGRVVKLLGDGVLMRFGDTTAAVEAALEVLELLDAQDLPPGHAGVAEGPIIGRDGDVFGRTVNLAARISDVAPGGSVYVTAEAGEGLTDRYRVEPIGEATLRGIGAVRLARVARTARR
jgi:class 3 adenylate cyclase